MKLIDAQAMIGSDIAVLNRREWRSRWKSLREGQYGVKAKLVAVGPYRLSVQGWCSDATSYSKMDCGTNYGVAEYEASDGKTKAYQLVSLNYLMTWADYTRIQNEAAMRDAELSIMQETKVHLEAKLADMRATVIGRLSRDRRSALVKTTRIPTDYSSSTRRRSDEIQVVYTWDDALATREMRDVEKRLAAIYTRLECRL